MDLQLLGVDHRVAAVELREHAARDAAAAQELLREGIAAGVWREALVLSTCNRAEVYAFAPDRGAFDSFVARTLGAEREQALAAAARRASDEAACRHLLRVACGLESRILGETEILGQVKDALALSRAAGASGPRLERLVAAALGAGRRGRAETALARGALSVASAAVSLAARGTAGFASRKVLVIGAGETGRLLALHAADKRAAALYVANRTAARAQALAREVRGRAVGLEDIDTVLDDVDVVLVAVRTEAPLLTRAALDRCVSRRAGRPLLVIDVSVPRAVEPGAAVNGVGVTLVSIDDVGEVVARNQSLREAEVRKVENIVAQECGRFVAWDESFRRPPFERRLRARFESIREAEVERHLAGFPAEHRRDIERLTRALVNKLLQAPASQLRGIDPRTAEGSARLRAAHELFGLTPEHEDILG